MNLNYVLSFKKILFILLPISLVSGPFLSDLSISLMAISFIIIALSKKDYKYFNNRFFYIIAVWNLYLILISSLSTDLVHSLSSSLFYWRHGLFALSVWYLLDNDKNILKNFTWSLTSIFLLLLIDAYLIFAFDVDLLGSNYRGTRLSGLFIDEYILGNYLSRLLPLVFAMMTIVYHKSPIMITLSMLLLIGSDIIIYVSGERTAFFYLMLSTILIIIFIDKWKMIRFISFVCSMIIIVIISFSVPNIKERMIDKTLDSTNILADEEEIVVFTPVHQSGYKSAYKMFINNIFVGVGPNMFRFECNNPKYYEPNGCSTHPHNTYLQLLAETGIIGAAPIIFSFFFVCFLFLKQSISILFKKTRAISDINVCLLAAVMITLWPIAPSLNFFNNWNSIVIYLPIGFIIYFYYKDKESSLIKI